MNADATPQTSAAQPALGRIGLIGLGAMGAGVAQVFAAQGGTACSSAAALASACDGVVSVVVDAAQTEDLLFGPGAVAAAMKPGSLGLVLHMARASKFQLPLSSTAHQMVMQASAAGFGKEDDSAVIKIFPGITVPEKKAWA